MKHGHALSFLALLLATFMLAFTFVSCDRMGIQNPSGDTGGSSGVSDEEINELTDEEKLQQGKDALTKKDYEWAYRLLSAIENKTEEQQELLGKFLFVRTAASSEAGNTAELIYSEDGLWLSEEYHYPNGAWNKTAYTYDDAANLIKEVFTNSAGMNRTIDYTYDARGNCLTENTFEAEDNWSNVTRTYDEKGNMLSERTDSQYSSPDLNWYLQEYTYDANSRVVRSVTTSSYDDYATTTVYTYDEQGNLVREEYDNGRGELCTTVFTHDALGNVLTRYCSYKVSKFWEKYVYTYDENGNELSCVNTDQLDRTSTWNYTYDENGNRIQDVYESDDDKISYDYTYDAKGNMLTELYTKRDGSWDKESYEYDIFGNQIVAEITDSDGNSEKGTATYRLFYYPNGVPANMLEKFGK